MSDWLCYNEIKISAKIKSDNWQVNMSNSDYDKIKLFHSYLEKRIQSKREERSMSYMSTRNKDLLKTEIAEAEVIFNFFKETFYDNS